MDNQHRQIKGYRELSQDEIDLMNRIKEKGAELQLQAEVARHLGAVDGSAHNRRAAAHNAQGGSYMRPVEVDPAVTAHFTVAEPHRWAAIAKTDLQTGIMALVRAVAQPTDC